MPSCALVDSIGRPSLVFSHPILEGSRMLPWTGFLLIFLCYFFWFFILSIFLVFLVPPFLFSHFAPFSYFSFYKFIFYLFLKIICEHHFPIQELFSDPEHFLKSWTYFETINIFYETMNIFKFVNIFSIIANIVFETSEHCYESPNIFLSQWRFFKWMQFL